MDSDTRGRPHRWSPGVPHIEGARRRDPYDSTIDEIRTERLVLRALRRGDLAAFVAYRREPSVARYQTWSVAYCMVNAQQLLSEHEEIKFGQPEVWVQLAVVDPTDDSLLGDCATRVLTDPPRTAEIGVTLAPAGQGRGLAREALRALITILFDQHAIHRVIAQVDDRNLPAQRLFEELGLRLEARLVEADWFKGTWATLRTYAVLEHEWRADRPGSR